MVGAAGFEPATLWSQTRCATRLRYAPIYLRVDEWSEQQDSNLRPSGPKPDALPGCAMLRSHQPDTLRRLVEAGI